MKYRQYMFEYLKLRDAFSNIYHKHLKHFRNHIFSAVSEARSPWHKTKEILGGSIHSFNKYFLK